MGIVFMLREYMSEGKDVFQTPAAPPCPTLL